MRKKILIAVLLISVGCSSHIYYPNSLKEQTAELNKNSHLTHLAKYGISNKK
jgi:peptidoglycan hydrolase CwlO-like protein